MMTKVWVQRFCILGKPFCQTTLGNLPQLYCPVSQFSYANTHGLGIQYCTSNIETPEVQPELDPAAIPCPSSSSHHDGDTTTLLARGAVPTTSSPASVAKMRKSTGLAGTSQSPPLPGFRISKKRSGRDAGPHERRQSEAYWTRWCARILLTVCKQFLLRGLALPIPPMQTNSIPLMYMLML